MRDLNRAFKAARKVDRSLRYHNYLRPCGDFDGGPECRHVSDCATDLSIREVDLTGFKTPNRGSVFLNGICYSSAVIARQMDD